MMVKNFADSGRKKFAQCQTARQHFGGTFFCLAFVLIRSHWSADITAKTPMSLYRRHGHNTSPVYVNQDLHGTTENKRGTRSRPVSKWKIDKSVKAGLCVLWVKRKILSSAVTQRVCNSLIMLEPTQNRIFAMGTAWNKGPIQGCHN